MATNVGIFNGRPHEQWTNATQPGDPTPAGYTLWDEAGNIVTQRALTADELAQLQSIDAALSASANSGTVQQRVVTALAANAAFLAAAKPATAAAQASQAYDQAVRLTREVNGIIKLLITQDFTDTTGT